MKNIFKNPYLNSLYAETYIIIVVWIMSNIGAPNTPDTFFDPVAALSLFVLSVAVMGYFFFGAPLQFYLAGKKNQSIPFFMKTVISFAVITAIVLIIVSIWPR